MKSFKKTLYQQPMSQESKTLISIFLNDYVMKFRSFGAHSGQILTATVVTKNAKLIKSMQLDIFFRVKVSAHATLIFLLPRQRNSFERKVKCSYSYNKCSKPVRCKKPCLKFHIKLLKMTFNA